MRKRGTWRRQQEGEAKKKKLETRRRDFLRADRCSTFFTLISSRTLKLSLLAELPSKGSSRSLSWSTIDLWSCDTTSSESFISPSLSFPSLGADSSPLLPPRPGTSPGTTPLLSSLPFFSIGNPSYLLPSSRLCPILSSTSNPLPSLQPTRQIRKSRYRRRSLLLLLDLDGRDGGGGARRSIPTCLFEEPKERRTGWMSPSFLPSRRSTSASTEILQFLRRLELPRT